jgi:hypothetical protein
LTDSRRDVLAFAAVLAALLGGLLHESLFLGKVLSPSDVLLATRGFAGASSIDPDDYEPAHRQLIDATLQFEPWLEEARAAVRSGRLPTWTDRAGCGAPLLANAQSGVFDPFHAIAYLGPLPRAIAWMALARLFVAGIGTFLLARSWGLGRWGRWFAGLAFPLCGFLIVWLMFPVTTAAVWLPWALLATDRVLDQPSARSASMLGLVVAATLLAGHVQTSAHVLLAMGFYTCWRMTSLTNWRRAAAIAWCGGVVLGVAIAAAQVVPLGVYLARSPVWTDRARQAEPAWSFGRPRWADAVGVALPYAYGSQRRGHPNLAKAFGAENTSERAGGFAGLATLLLLAPCGLKRMRADARVRFLAALGVVGFLGSIGLPPVAQALRALPVLDVMDHRRLGLWVAFALVLLGGVGLDRLTDLGRAWRWGVLAMAGALLAVAIAVPRFDAVVRSRALAHYADAAARTAGADAAAYAHRAARQADATARFLPWYFGIAAAQMGALAGVAWLLGRGRIETGRARAIVAGLAIADLVAFGHHYNPAIDANLYRPDTALMAHLRRVASMPARVLGVGEELPPNTASRYGLADARNYDSVEVAAAVAWLEPLYETSVERTSRREVTWSGVARARGRLRDAGVVAVVGGTAPPPGLFDRVDRVGRVWVGLWPDAAPSNMSFGSGSIDVFIMERGPAPVVVPMTWAPGWRGRDETGADVAVSPARGGAAMTIGAPAGARRVHLRHDPIELRAGVCVSLVALGLAGAGLVSRLGLRTSRKPGHGAWRHRTIRGRIEPVISGRTLSPALPTGSDADGPLHV